MLWIVVEINISCSPTGWMSLSIEKCSPQSRTACHCLDFTGTNICCGTGKHLRPVVSETSIFGDFKKELRSTEPLWSLFIYDAVSPRTLPRTRDFDRKYSDKQNIFFWMEIHTWIHEQFQTRRSMACTTVFNFDNNKKCFLSTSMLISCLL